jgi:hypothetical protein
LIPEQAEREQRELFAALALAALSPVRLAEQSPNSVAQLWCVA